MVALVGFTAVVGMFLATLRFVPLDVLADGRLRRRL